MISILILLFILICIFFIKWFVKPIKIAHHYIKLKKGLENSEAFYYDPISLKYSRFYSLSTLKAECYLTVIIPAYNEEERITEMLIETIEFFDEKKKLNNTFNYEIIVVDDHSTDNTVDIVNKLIKKYTINKLKLLKLKENHGKGGAIRKGMLVSSGEYILFVDADGATNINDYNKLQEVANKNNSNSSGIIVCGSRAHLEVDAISKRNPIRNILMHGFHLIVSTLCVDFIRDTQCGFKLFDRKSAQLLFPPLHIERWAFDVELLYLARLLSIPTYEVAVRWEEIPGSKMNLISATLTMLREIILIRLCYTYHIWKPTDGGFRLDNVEYQ